MKKTKKNDLIGASLNLLCEIKHAPSTEENSVPRFTMVAYTGSAMNVANQKTPVIVELNGIHPKSQRIPVLMGHSWRQGVGHTERIAVENGALIAEGIVSRKTENASDFIASSKEGFPWQASIGGSIVDAYALRENESRVINGGAVTGPVLVVSNLQLYEISVVEYGADGATSSGVKCQLFPKGTKMNESENEPVVETNVAASQPTQEPVAQPEPKQLNAATQAPPDDSWLQRRRALEAQELERLEEIHRRGNGLDRTLEAQAIKEGWSPDQFELALLRAHQPTAPAVHTPSPTFEPETFVITALRASGIQIDERKYTDKQLSAADSISGCGIQEFCELVCRGRYLPRARRDTEGFLQAAFSGGDLSYVLTRTANSSLIEGFNYVENEWRQLSKIGATTDFKEHERYRMNSSFKFERIPVGGTFKNGGVGDEKFGIKVNTEGIAYSIDRQIIINDDLGALSDIPRQIGMGAADAINDAFWALFMAPPQDESNNNFYSAAHNNLLTGNPLSLNALTAANVQFAKQTRPKTPDSKNKDRRTGVRPSILLVPIDLEAQALMLTKSTSFNESATAGNPAPANYNPYGGRYKVVSSAFLSDSQYAGYSSTAWYFLADPNRLPAFEVAFLNGKDTPTIEKADANFDVLGFKYRGYIDFGVREQDYRGVLKVAGA